MSNEQPQGAHSADPVREARKFIDKNGGYQSTRGGIEKEAHDAWVTVNTWGLSRDDFIRLSYFHGDMDAGSDGSGPINGSEDRPGDAVYCSPSGGVLTRSMVSYWLSDCNSFMHGYRKARAALAAPEGPAPTHEVARKDGSMSFEEAQDLARKHAKAEPESYYAEPFEPHLWVINAIVEASAHWYQRAVDERVRRVKEANSRAPEAPPPVEARQPQTGEPWDGIKYLLDSYPGAVRCRYKGLDEDLLASLSVTFIGLRDAARAALAAPAGAIQPHLDHQVESSSGTAAALGRITLLKGSVVKMGGLPHELLADVESYCASRAAAPQGGDTGAPS